MATYRENSCSFGLRYVSWYKYLIVSLVFSHYGFWSGNLFRIAPFPDLCLLVHFCILSVECLSRLKRIFLFKFVYFFLSIQISYIFQNESSFSAKSRSRRVYSGLFRTFDAHLLFKLCVHSLIVNKPTMHRPYQTTI